ncbi:Fc.00g093370.m01.CDS01 [Cosmosporella sp. VM-42]
MDPFEVEALVVVVVVVLAPNAASIPTCSTATVDESSALHRIRSDIDLDHCLDHLRGLAEGIISWDDFVSFGGQHGLHPPLSVKEPYMNWKQNIAKGIAVDDAGRISRPGLYCAWGSALLPCLLAGDDKEHAHVMTVDNKDAEGYFRNRHRDDGKLSLLAFLKATGWPVYRQWTQLRMATGPFDTCHREVYSDMPMEYGTGSQTSLHPDGESLEEFLQSKFPALKAPTAGTFQPAFIHYQNSFCLVKIALDFLVELATTKDMDPAQVTVLTPYKANVTCIERMRKRQAEHSVLQSMGPAIIIDGFRGQEGDIVAVLMVDTELLGPGSTNDNHLLNVMASRPRSGLLVFGDINVSSPITNGYMKGSQIC